MARHAVFTIVQDDPTNLRIWALYYRQYYAYSDCYVLHHPTPGEPAEPAWLRDASVFIADNRHGAGAPDDRGFVVVPVFRDESFNHAWLRETVQRFQRFLLGSYDTVLFTEIDEIVVPVSDLLRPYGLDVYLDDFLARRADRVRCTGYEVVHDYSTEPSLDFDEPPLLKQRTYWYRATQYDKVLLSRVPLTWTNGFHTLQRPEQPLPGHNWQGEPDPNLRLLHLHKLDFATALVRHRRAASRRWSQEDLRRNRGFQSRIVDEAALRDWWLNTVDQVGVRSQWNRIPEAIKEVV